MAKVLLVDDDREFVEVTSILLESNDFDVATAYNAEDGKQAAVAEQPDVIILDVMMETQTAGFDAARWLREREETADIPIILLTAVNQEVPWRFESDEVWLPVDEFLDKPVSPEKLLNEVQKVTDKA
ncbi:MAG: response regulator transcription factor [Planctomycetota bacterium]